eukprot:CAMPEP_0201572938 /NCGR_PEP_ID=MMETSP0190_2-20130828/16493_1 /ASSEMBLY_ACC=CAM_ASM_000263 /TAXON_ID=37353 /ORGANISM="Rosalina sp." /LENGTH=372 /DNA_ID=CAMNT_0047999315 /DNA_START=70 /DNA_END=1185 /DNA_ORIENTATION=-
MSVTSAVSQTLTDLYPIKIANDFHKYLEEEEYDSEVLRDDLKDDEPFFVEYIIQQNPNTFKDEAEKDELIHNVKNLMGRTQNPDDQDFINNAEPVEIEVLRNAEPNVHPIDNHEDQVEEIQDMDKDIDVNVNENEDEDESVSDDNDNHQMSAEEEEEASMKLINELMMNEQINNNENDNQLSNNNLNDGEWACEHCTFTNNTDTNICFMCHKTSNVSIHSSEQKEEIHRENEEEKWNCIYQELQEHYLSKDLCNKYYSTILDIVTKNKFEMDEAEEDLNEFAAIDNESLIAEGIIDKFGWKQNDIHIQRLIDCLKHAFSKKNEPEIIPVSHNHPKQGKMGKVAKKEEDIFHVNDVHEHNNCNHHGVANIDTW